MAAISGDDDRITTPIAWVSDDPHLSGNFAPIGPEIDASDLPVVAGRIPEELSGAYLRNGPNPLFQPISYSYPFDGDGMIHGVYLAGGKARYRNRFVRTRGLAVERRVGRAVYGGVMRPVPVDPALVGADGDPGPFKNGACVHVIRHAGKVLALYEAAAGYELSLDLATLGEWRAGTEAPLELGAHNRRHPRTGELFALTYAIDRPLVRFHRIGADGRLAASFPLELSAPTMIHDFVLTERHIVILACPLVFDVAAAMRGQSPLQWRPELGTRIAVVRLDGGPALWLDAEPFFVFHFANGFEEQGRIVLDYVRHARLGLLPGGAGGERVPPSLHRMAIDLAGKRIEDGQVAEALVEFPRADERREALPTRYVYAPTLTASFTGARVAGTFNAMARIDAQSGDMACHDFGDRLAGEAAFVPRPGGTAEDHGWLALFVFDPATATSDFVLLDAARVDGPSVAVVRLPQRVPQGLHGSWLAN